MADEAKPSNEFLLPGQPGAIDTLVRPDHVQALRDLHAAKAQQDRDHNQRHAEQAAAHRQQVDALHTQLAEARALIDALGGEELARRHVALKRRMAAEQAIRTHEEEIAKHKAALAAEGGAEDGA
jgi:hypothetical protein